MEYQKMPFSLDFTPLDRLFMPISPFSLYSRYIFNKKIYLHAACIFYYLYAAYFLLYSLPFQVYLHAGIYYIYIKRVFRAWENGENRMGTGFTLGKSRKTREKLGKTLWDGVLRGFLFRIEGAFPNNILTKNLLGPTPETLDQRQ